MARSLPLVRYHQDDDNAAVTNGAVGGELSHPVHIAGASAAAPDEVIFMNKLFSWAFDYQG